MIPCTPSVESYADTKEMTGMDYINNCVSRSNALVKNDSYYIQLVFLGCGDTKDRQFAKDIFRGLKNGSKQGLKVTYLVGMDTSDKDDGDTLFMQDGKHILFDKKEYDSVHRLFEGLPAQKRCTVQIVIFKVKGGIAITEDACECRCMNISDKAQQIVSSDSELSKISAGDGLCYNEISSMFVDQIRPLTKDHDPDVRTLKRSTSLIPGKGQIYLHQYRRGIALLMLNAVMLITTVCYCFMVLVNGFKPASPILFLIAGTICLWFYSVDDDVERIYSDICDGRIEVDFEYLPPPEGGHHGPFLPVYLLMFGFMLTVGLLRVMRLDFEPIEYVICVSVGAVCIIAALILFYIGRGDRSDRL